MQRVHFRRGDGRRASVHRPLTWRFSVAALLGLACIGFCTSPAGGSPAKHRPRLPTTALAVTRGLKSAGMSIGTITNYTAATDPNHLLGRPNGYKSKTAFIDKTISNSPGTATSVTRGGSVEFFANHAGAVRRERYIEKVEKAAPILGTEYDYVDGPALLRLSSVLTPSEAKVYRRVFADVMAGKKVNVKRKLSAPTKPRKASQTTPTNGATPAAAVTIAPFMGGTAKPSLAAGAAGKLDVIYVGTPISTGTTTVAVVVWNGMSHPVNNVDVSGSASVGGAVVGSGDSQDVEPENLAPGDAAFGKVYFQTAVPSAATFDLTATASSGTSTYFLDAHVSQATLVPPATGTSTRTAAVVGTITNPTQITMSGPISVNVYCFTGGALSKVDDGFMSGTRKLTPNANGSYSVTVPSSCTTYLVGASGFGKL